MPAPSPDAWVTTPVLAATAAVLAGAATAEEALSHAVPPFTLPTLATAATGQWASFVGMVQDVWDAELFVLRDSSNRSALLVEDIPDSSSAAVAQTPAPVSPVLSERLPVYLVAPPGLSDWAAPGLGHDTRRLGRGAQRAKRPREDSGGVPPVYPTVVAADSNPLTNTDAGASAAMPPPPPKRPAHESPGSTRHPGLGPNTPLGGGSAAIAKFYGVEAASLKVHTLVRVTGIVAAAPGRSSADWEGAGGDDAGFFANELAARNPAGIPRLHVLKYEVMSGPSPLNPLLSGLDLEAARGDLLSTAMPSLRADLIQYMASVLGGDELAAEYLLMNVLGRATARTDSGTVIGKLSVNLVLPADGTVSLDELIEALRALLPAVAHVRVDIPSLNASPLFPQKDYEANRLRAAPLQLPAGCALVADETRLSNGQLQERGVKNVRALASASSKAMIPVDFKYYETELMFDATTLFVSSGCKSIVPVDAVVRVVPEPANISKPWRSCDENTLRKLRLAASLLADSAVKSPDGTPRDFEIPDSVGKAVEETFVEARRTGRIAGSEGQEVLSRWLAIARASARSFGETALQVARWEYAVGLEHRRDERNAAVSTPSRGNTGPVPVGAVTNSAAASPAISTGR